MMVAANDFRRQWDDVRDDALAAMERVGASGWYILGQEVAKFETELATLWQIEHAVGVANGTDAIELALRAVGCGPGDRVLTTPLSAFATTLAILKVGAIPVFADTDERGLIDLDRCREVLAARPEIRFFVPVHLYGHVLDLNRLGMLRDEFGLRIVEDCAQSAGAQMHGTHTGGAGQIAATSFYPTKNLGAMGDGGAVLTNDPALAERVRVLRSYGETARYRHEEIGVNSRLDELQAAVLRDVGLPRLKRWVQRRRQIAEAYLEGIHNPAVKCPGAPAGSRSSWHLFPVHVDPRQRRAFLEYLRGQTIAAGVHYPVAIPDQPAMGQAKYEMANDCATARRICASEVSLPIHPYLTDEEVGQVIDAVNGWQAQAQAPDPGILSAAQSAGKSDDGRIAKTRVLMSLARLLREPVDA